MDAFVPLEYTFVAISVFSGIGNYTLHHYGMSLEQILFRKRL